MDYINFILYAVLAVLTYLLLLAWQRDYPADIAKIAASQARPQDTLLTLGIPNTDLPSQIPREAKNSLQEGQLEINPAPNLVTVNTDTFELTIDLNGGDIVYLALPQYLKHADIPNDPFVLLESTPTNSYISQSGLIGLDDNDSRAAYRSNSTDYRMEESENSLIVELLTSSSSGVEVTKQFIFKRGSYLINVNFKVNNTTSETWQANPFGQIRRNAYDDPSKASGFTRTFLGFVTTSKDDPYLKIDFEDIDDGAITNDMNGGWIGFSQHYFLSAWIPDSAAFNSFSVRKNSSDQYYGGFASEALVVEPNSQASHKMQFYAGPKEQYRLEAISPNLELTIDYGVLGFIASPIHWLLTRINSILGNFGFSIIFLTVIVKGMFFKLSESQYKSTAGMKKLAPKLQQLRERLGDDKLRLQKETMELYKKENVSLLGGCLPALVQMPVFFALYWVLIESVELRHAPFLMWITDLSVMDPYFMLPLLMAAGMYLQSSMNPTPADPMQAKLMKLLPIMMTVFFLFSPAGLVLYWLTNSSLSMLHQWVVSRRITAIA